MSAGWAAAIGSITARAGVGHCSSTALRWFESTKVKIQKMISDIIESEEFLKMITTSLWLKPGSRMPGEMPGDGSHQTRLDLDIFHSQIRITAEELLGCPKEQKVAPD